jgi:predicted acyl esterase
MKPTSRSTFHRRIAQLIVLLSAALTQVASQTVSAADQKAESKPAKLEPADREYLEANYTKFEFKIPMRDGVRLFTAVYAPKDESESYPILIQRTPYGIRPYGVDNFPDPGGQMAHYGREKFIFTLRILQPTP